MRRTSLRKCNAIIPFHSFFDSPHSSAIRVYSSCHSNTVRKGKVGLNSKIEKEVKCLDDALNLFHQMIRVKPIPSVLVFCKLFNTMLSMKHYSSVVSLFRQMRKLGIPLNDFILNILINTYFLMHHIDCAFSVLPIYLKNGIPFDVVTFNTLLRGIFADNKVRDAVELFRKLVREKICEPDEVMYATVMNGLSKRGHTQKTLSLLRLMEQGNTKPNIYIYSIVIDSLCKDGNFDAAITLLNGMKHKDVHIFTILTDGLCKEGKVADAEEVMSHMIEKGLVEVGRTGDAKQIYAEMLSAGPKPDIFTHTTLLDGYFKHGLVEEVFSSMDCAKMVNWTKLMLFLRSFLSLDCFRM